MPQFFTTTVRIVTATIVLALLPAHSSTLSNTDAPIIRTADIGHGIALHYTEEGTGTPVIFVHGSLSDGGYWLLESIRFCVQELSEVYTLVDADRIMSEELARLRSE